jgi:nucleoside-diphosphate-sugar epimerase
VNGPLGVLVAARECGVKKVVYASSSSKIRLHYPCWREWKEFAPKLQVQEIRKKSL